MDVLCAFYLLEHTTGPYISRRDHKNRTAESGSRSPFASSNAFVTAAAAADAAAADGRLYTE